MNRIITFSSRNFKEIVRDPLSYIFCLGFPIVMLIVMSMINESIPKEANMTLFRIDNLSGGIAVFGLTFIMLFICLSVSKDRGGAFLTRLYSTPMRSADLILGYMLPSSLLAVIQIAITFIASFIISLITGIELNIPGLLLGILTLIPSVIMFAAFGLLFGTLFSEKAAPGLCSVVISFASFLGGVWFDVDNVGGGLNKFCNVLPFVHAVKSARLAISGDFSDIGTHLLITIGYAAVLTAAAIMVFSRKMKADIS